MFKRAEPGEQSGPGIAARRAHHRGTRRRDPRTSTAAPIASVRPMEKSVVIQIKDPRDRHPPFVSEPHAAAATGLRNEVSLLR